MNFKRIFNVAGILNVVGMTFAFATFYILAVQLNFDLNYNKPIKDNERVFAVTTTSWYDGSKTGMWQARGYIEDIMRDNPMVESYGILTSYNGGSSSPIYYKDCSQSAANQSDDSWKTFYLNYYTYSSGTIETWGINILEGSREEIDKQYSVIVSKYIADYYNIKIGDMFSLDEKHGQVVTVAGIFEDLPCNCDAGMINILYNIGEQHITNKSEWSYAYYVKLVSPEMKEDFEKSAFNKIRSMEISSSQEEWDKMDEEHRDMMETQFKKSFTFKLYPIAETYFATNLQNSGRTGSYNTALAFLFVAILIILVAFINYINFFFAQVPTRIKNINTRKILGSSRLSLIYSMICESFITISISLVFATVVIVLFKNSTMVNMLTSPIDFELNVPIIVLTISIAFVAALVSSIYPALYITSFSPAFALKGAFNSTRTGKIFRYMLIGLQFTFSIMMIIGAIFVSLNHDYVLKKDIGINREHLLAVYANGTIIKAQEGIESKLKSNPMIEDVAWGQATLVSLGRMGWGRQIHDENCFWECYPVSWNFLKLMGIEITEGRNFMPSDEQSEHGAIIFNETAKKQFNLSIDECYGGHHEQPAILAGFCKDFNFKPVTAEITPFAFYVYGKDPWDNWMQGRRMYIRTTADADVLETIDYIRETFKEFDPSIEPHQLNIQTFDEELRPVYAQMLELAKLISLFSVVAISIALMGLFGLVLFETQYRRKEIGIRRVLGATIFDILSMINKKFIIIVLICFAIGAPIIYQILDAYLNSFANHCPMYWWVYVLTLAIVLVITTIVVTIRSWGAASDNPVNAIRTE